ncbi:CRISPR-associated endonuclease Cas2 [Lachnospiraceae bacterium KK002]
MSKFMRMIVFFDLPVVTAKERKAAAKFRNFLLKDGYHMMQFSVYTRICNGMDAVEKHEARLNLNLPSKGSVRLLTITEKQYESIHILLGKKTFDDTGESSELLNIF